MIVYREYPGDDESANSYRPKGLPKPGPDSEEPPTACPHCFNVMQKGKCSACSVGQK